MRCGCDINEEMARDPGRVAGSYPGSAPWCCQRSPGVNIPTLELTRASAAGETRPPAQVLTLWWSVVSCEGAFCLDCHTVTQEIWTIGASGAPSTNKLLVSPTSCPAKFPGIAGTEIRSGLRSSDEASLSLSLSDKLFPSYRRGRGRHCWVGSRGQTGGGGTSPRLPGSADIVCNWCILGRNLESSGSCNATFTTTLTVSHRAEQTRTRNDK